MSLDNITNGILSSLSTPPNHASLLYEQSSARAKFRNKNSEDLHVFSMESADN